MAKEVFKIEDPLLHPYTILKEKHGGYVIEEIKQRVTKADQSVVDIPRAVRYPTTVAGALKWIVEAKLADREANITIQQYIEELKAVEHHLDEITKK
jgi:hypothetical protein